MKKRLIQESDEFENREGTLFASKISGVLLPIIKEYADNNYSIVDMDHIIRQEVNLCLLCFKGH